MMYFTAILKSKMAAMEFSFFFIFALIYIQILCKSNNAYGRYSACTNYQKQLEITLI